MNTETKKRHTGRWILLALFLFLIVVVIVTAIAQSQITAVVV